MKNKYFASNVIRIEVPGRHIVNLINPLNVSFKLNYIKDTPVSVTWNTILFIFFNIRKLPKNVLLIIYFGFVVRSKELQQVLSIL